MGLTRVSGGCEPRGAFGLRRVYRRFRTGETILVLVPQWEFQAQGAFPIAVLADFPLIGVCSGHDRRQS